MRKFALLALMSLIPLNAADLPSHFTGAGLGFQNSATPRASGWFTTCVLAVERTYTCLASDYSGSTTSTRADVHVLAVEYRACAVFGTAGPGAATGSTGGIGGSFDAGGLIGCKVPSKLFRVPGMVAVFSGSWNKRNVVEAPDIGTAARTFGAQTIWRFGVGKAW